MSSSTSQPEAPKRALHGMPNFEDLLVEANGNASSMMDVPVHEGDAFRALYEGWVRQGGYNKGKPRRSVRQIKIWLGENREVRSLETKLAGKTLLQLVDVRNLIGLFLERWRYDASKDEDLSYPGGDIERLADNLATEIYPTDDDGRSVGLQLPRRTKSHSPEVHSVSRSAKTRSRAWERTDVLDDTQDSEEAIAELYVQSDALITVSRERTFIGRDPGSIRVAFQLLMDRLRKIDEGDDRLRTLIWIADIGSREGDARAQTILHNLDFLAGQFRSLWMTEHPEREARRRWFGEHAVVLVGALQQPEIDALYVESGLKPSSPNRRGDWITADRLFIDGVPDSWFERIANEGPAAIEQRTITVHRDLEQRRQSHAGGFNWNDLRFLMHAPLRSVDDKVAPRCVELPSLDRRWSDSFRMAHEVALLRLNQRISPTLKNTPEQGLALLRDDGFAVMTAIELCKLANRLAFQEFEA